MVSCSEVTLNTKLSTLTPVMITDNGRLLYTVVYEDDDREDLDPQECEEVVTLSDPHTPHPNPPPPHHLPLPSL